MQYPFFIIVLLICSLSCSQNTKTIIEKDVQEHDIGDLSNFDKDNPDTIYCYWQIDTSVYFFDTTYNSKYMSVKTWSLNDSNVCSEPVTRIVNGKKIVEYSVAHNYKSQIKVGNDTSRQIVSISLSSFKDSLSDEFVRIAHLWYNQFEKFYDGTAIYRAKVSKPDSDYQYDFIYYITNRGEIEIMEMETGM